MFTLLITGVNFDVKQISPEFGVHSLRCLTFSKVVSSEWRINLVEIRQWYRVSHTSPRCPKEQY